MPAFAEADIGRLEKNATRAAKALKSLSNKWRLLILCQLLKGELSVGEILKRVELSQSALSQHLAVLRASKLVTTRRESQTIFYSVRGEEVPILLAALYQAYCETPAPAETAPHKRKSRARTAATA